MFKEQSVRHGRGLLEMFVKLAPEFGYKFLAIECANKNAAAFGKRMGFTPIRKGSVLVGGDSHIQADSRKKTSMMDRMRRKFLLDSGLMMARQISFLLYCTHPITLKIMVIHGHLACREEQKRAYATDQ
jgi:hypothetical protein